MKKRIIGIACALVLLLALPVNARAVSGGELDAALSRTADFCLSGTPSPGVGAQWIIMALAGGDFALPSGYLEGYYKAMEDYVSSCGGVLSGTKYTEYSGAVLGITAAGYDASDVAGYDLTEALSDYSAVKRQGLNGPVFALLALDSGGYPCPIRADYVDYILSRQLEDGGWAFSGAKADADMTAMVLQALAGYTDRADVAGAVEDGVACLSGLQKEDGGYENYGVPNSESTAQVIIALCELGISVEDPRFVKNGQTLLDVLISYQEPDGSFRHSREGERDGMATGQAFMAMVAAGRQADGHGGLYAMDDRYEAPRFSDISGHWAEEAILYCSDAELFQGTSDREFSPEGTMSRAMLVTVLWRLDGKPAAPEKCAFSDVPEGAYYAEAIAWASGNGITEGYGSAFGVNDSVTRQQLALFLCRYAKYKGMDTTAGADLSGFSDAGAVASWAEEAMSWANGAGLVTGAGGRLLPGSSATRAQVAVVLMRFVEGTT